MFRGNYCCYSVEMGTISDNHVNTLSMISTVTLNHTHSRQNIPGIVSKMKLE